MLLYTSSTLAFSPVSDLTIPGKRSYCERHGYEFINDILPPDCRIPRMERLLDHLNGEGWIWFTGGDVLITNHAKRITDHIDDNFDLIIGLDKPSINNDSFLIRRCEDSRKFITSVIEALRHGGNDQDLMRERLGMLRTMIVNQREFNSYRYDVYIPQYYEDDIVRSVGVPQCLIPLLSKHYIDNVSGSWRAGDLALHLPGMANEKRIEIIKAYQPITVLTAASRPHNWRALRDCLEPQGVIWRPIILPEFADHPDLVGDWIDPLIVSSWSGPDPCYGKLNEAIKAGLDPDRFYHFLNDDDLLHVEFYAKLGMLSTPITVVSMRRGDIHPETSRNCLHLHPNNTLIASQYGMKRDRVGLEQMIIKGSLLSGLRFEEGYHNADGRFAEMLHRRFPRLITYRPELVVYFNALEPERWNTTPWLDTDGYGVNTKVPTGGRDSIAFVQLGGFGDLVLLLPICKYHADQGRKVGICVQEYYASVLESVSYVTAIKLPIECAFIKVAERHALDAGWEEVIICQTFANRTRTKRGADNFNIAQWMRCGMLDRFHDLPLVFDNRNERHDREALSHLPRGDNRPLMVYHLIGKSQPFKHAEEFKAWLESEFPEFRKLDLGQLRLPSVQNLLPLIERAAVLVSVDTCCLHLGYASNTPTIALLPKDPFVRAEFRKHWVYWCTHDEAMTPAARLKLKLAIHGKHRMELARNPLDMTVRYVWHAVNYFWRTNVEKQKVLQAQRAWEYLRTFDDEHPGDRFFATIFHEVPGASIADVVDKVKMEEDDVILYTDRFTPLPKNVLAWARQDPANELRCLRTKDGPVWAFTPRWWSMNRHSFTGIPSDLGMEDLDSNEVQHVPATVSTAVDSGQSSNDLNSDAGKEQPRTADAETIQEATRTPTTDGSGVENVHSGSGETDVAGSDGVSSDEPERSDGEGAVPVVETGADSVQSGGYTAEVGQEAGASVDVLEQH